jgi:hypothetical protein
MQSNNLNLRQLAAIRKKFQDTRKYLDKLLKRMDSQGFPEHDPLRMKAVESRRAVVGMMGQIANLARRKHGGSVYWRDDD